jgi:carboxylate-amine ligase
MALEPFSSSRSLSLGVELELQIVDTYDYDLSTTAADLLRLMEQRNLPGEVKPEMTSSMIELSTGICADHNEAFSQLGEIRDALVDAADRLNIGLCGGGTHPFQQWGERRIFDSPRFHYLSDLYGYLSKQFTVFGQHVHIGCADANEALFLLHCLSRYVPHFIALSASSPFVQNVDTGFQSARLNSVFAFPMSGRSPFVESWSDFEKFFNKVASTGVINSMKDFYWDIRPKPEFGTIEVRVMDTPLTVARAAQIAGYIQALARWLITERPFKPTEDDYLVYTFNRFQACRFGFEGTYVDPGTHERRSLKDDILTTFAKIEPHAIHMRADTACIALLENARHARNDAVWLRETLMQTRSLPETVRQQCLRWRQ